MTLIAFVLIWWTIAYTTEKAADQWRHTRDRHAQVIHAANPSWHPRKVRRHARRRALSWWWHEAREGFPAIRTAWGEDREHIRWLREQQQLATETRRAVWRREISELRAQRNAHAEATRTGATKDPFPIWLADQQAARQRPPRQGRPAAKPAPAPAAAPAAPAAAASSPADAGPVRGGAAVLTLVEPQPAPSPIRSETATSTGGTAMTTPNGGSMEAPNIDQARQIAMRQAQGLQSAVSGGEQYVNDMLAGGMGADAATIQAAQTAQEATAAAAAAWAQVVSGINKHTAGEEYANSGIAAKTEYLKQ
jgi:hypothetical protein